MAPRDVPDKRISAKGYVTCEPCGKRRYYDRKMAKYAARMLRENGVREYRFLVADGWHVGHLPEPVRHGELAAADIFGRA